MNLQEKIENEIQKVPNIKLKEENFIGHGAYADVYWHEIEKTKIAVKCFQLAKYLVWQ